MIVFEGVMVKSLLGLVDGSIYFTFHNYLLFCLFSMTVYLSVGLYIFMKDSNRLGLGLGLNRYKPLESELVTRDILPDLFLIWSTRLMIQKGIAHFCRILAP
ncbi:hypothetical protein OPV22_006829 [Ensete ventricosum]|uniref:Uncharacterized protein n=1 Tax=Ensete ventricosum TaxID=4639 RepID=A0AAV8RQG8_ENSVE|nr:hypothetical protein OPV22_006829 [Ensete ventricosum]